MKSFTTVIAFLFVLITTSCGPPIIETAKVAVAIPTYFALTENSYAKEGEIQIKNLEQSATNFYQQNGRMPGDCYEEMEQSGAIEMKQSVIDAWEFQCDWLFDYDEKQMTGTITATSTESNNAGSGIIIEYDILTGEFDAFIKNKIK